VTPEQYLILERAAEFRHEYYDGKMVERAVSSYRHVVIVSNLCFAIGNRIRNSRWFVLTVDMRTQVSPMGPFTYPDVLIVCDKPLFADNQQDTLLNPKVLIEVLSPSTEAHDRGVKFSEYRKLDSLEEYVLVSQHQPRVEKFRRQADGLWLFSEAVGLESTITLESVECSIPLAEIYANVDFVGPGF
jgi:Uma2 family endonuclease